MKFFAFFASLWLAVLFLVSILFAGKQSCLVNSNGPLCTASQFMFSLPKVAFNDTSSGVLRRSYFENPTGDYSDDTMYELILLAKGNP